MPQSSYWGYWLIVMGVAIVGLMISVQGVTTNTTQDYYSIKEIAEASMLEAVDYGYYRDYNEVKMNKEKFMEVFLRMLAETITNETYEINFYEMYEAPPKVSVEIRSHSGANFVGGDYDTTTRVDAIIQIFAEDGNTSSANTDDDDDDSGNNNNTQVNTPTVPDDVVPSGSGGNTSGDSSDNTSGGTTTNSGGTSTGGTTTGDASGSTGSTGGTTSTEPVVNGTFDPNNPWGTITETCALTVKDHVYYIRPQTADCNVPRFSDATEGLEPHFYNALMKLIKKGEEVGCSAYINSGYRSYEEQEKLWIENGYVEALAAKPGESKHNYGIAADLAYSPNTEACKKVYRDNANAIGLSFNMYKPPVWEWWHVQPTNIVTQQ